MKCLESDYDETQVNLFAKKVAEECRRAVNVKPTTPPCKRSNRKPPTLHTFCNHNINIQYKYQNNEKSGTTKPCGICIKTGEEVKREKSYQISRKKGMTAEEKLAEGIKCIARPLPRWFNQPVRSCDSMSVCCRKLGIIKECSRLENPCSCSQPKTESKKNKFAVNYPKSKLATHIELHENLRCKPNFRCQKTLDDDRHKFKPNFRDFPLTEKFYSKYEHLKNIDTPEVRQYENEQNKIESFSPREVFCVPRYTNQNYGWLDSKKLQNLEFCDANRGQAAKVLQNLNSHEGRRFDPIQLQYCLCHNMMKQVGRWKIV